jgi:hypothetical protein
MMQPVLPKLPKHEEERYYSKYYYNISIAPQEYWDSLENNPIQPEQALNINNRNDIFNEGYLQCERGWCVMPDGTGFCAGHMQFPGLPPDALDWWFPWMTIDPLRGKIWEPRKHQGFFIPREVAHHLADPKIPIKERMWGAYFFPYDRGVVPNPDALATPAYTHFISPKEFGYDPDRIKAAGDISVMCCQVGIPVVTSFTHIGRKTEKGFELRSRFWFGWQIKDGKAVHSDIRMPEKFVINACTTQSVHLIEEYYQLSKILPDLYARYRDKTDCVEDYF